MSSLDLYELIQEVGSGAYSTVYKAKKITDGRIYGIKKINISPLNYKERMNALNEITLLSGIEHPNVVQYKDSFLSDESKYLCLVMDFAPEGDVFAKIKKAKMDVELIDEGEIWNIIIQVLRGLKSLHAQHIVHRDIKSANIFLYQDGLVKIGDLNVSKILKDGMNYTQTGTPYYASPEVWENKKYDGRSDIWSLGCVLFECLMHDPPFKEACSKFDINLLKTTPVPKIDPQYGYSDDIEQLVNMMLIVDTDLRPTAEKILSYPIVQEMEERYCTQNFTETEVKIDNKKINKKLFMPENPVWLNFRLPRTEFGKPTELRDTELYPKYEEKKAYQLYPNKYRKIRKPTRMKEKENPRDFYSNYQKIREQDELEKLMRERAHSEKIEKGIGKFNSTSNPYYNALENTKLGPGIYKGLKLPLSTAVKTKEEEFGMKFTPASRNAVDNEKKRRIAAIETISLRRLVNNNSQEQIRRDDKMYESKYGVSRYSSFGGMIDLDKIRRKAMLDKY
ncbi:unnamed protein product [Moneuplotes crassus]|uniref:non-specific serine/threonine protein kinase n=2 Tax=Euplotes crassus TaxID=5936 RepID=A0AAD2D9D9_EUPCR|nr:unnamed protein product [Moneuplotes crassus]